MRCARSVTTKTLTKATAVIFVICHPVNQTRVAFWGMDVGSPDSSFITPDPFPDVAPPIVEMSHYALKAAPRYSGPSGQEWLADQPPGSS